MARRTQKKQSKHDAAVAGLKSNYAEKDYTTWSNPNGKKNKKFKGYYPDVLVKVKGKKDRYYVFEVETDDSVTQDEAEAQWVDYDEAYSQCWYLAVPKGQKANAQALLDNNEIEHCEVVTWQRNDDGTHTFWGLPGSK